MSWESLCQFKKIVQITFLYRSRYISYGVFITGFHYGVFVIFTIVYRGSMKFIYLVQFVRSPKATDSMISQVLHNTSVERRFMFYDVPTKHLFPLNICQKIWDGPRYMYLYTRKDDFREHFDRQQPKRCFMIQLYDETRSPLLPIKNFGRENLKAK